VRFLTSPHWVALITHNSRSSDLQHGATLLRGWGNFSHGPENFDSLTFAGRRLFCRAATSCGGGFTVTPARPGFCRLTLRIHRGFTRARHSIVRSLLRQRVRPSVTAGIVSGVATVFAPGAVVRFAPLPRWQLIIR